jgi:predicted XRE-type DNA-binding protein
MTQARVAARFGVTQPRLNALPKIDQFSLNGFGKKLQEPACKLKCS